MAGLSAYEIYNALQNGPGSGSLHGAYDTAGLESKQEEARAKRINQLAGKIEAGWQGEAGTAAFGAARPIAVVSAVGAANLEITHRLLNQQTHSFDTAKGNVKPVAERPPETGIIDDLSPWETDAEEAQAQHQADSDHNIRVYGQYDQQSWDNESALPMDYSTLHDPGGEIVIRKPDEPPPPPREPGGGGDEVTTPPGGGDRRTPPTPPPPGGDPTRPQWSDPTTPQQHDPRTPPAQPLRPPTPPTPPGLPPFTPPEVPPYGPGLGRGPGGPGTGRGPGGPGTGRGPGGPGTGGAGSGRGPGGAGPRPGGYGPGGPGALGAAPNETGARAGAGSGDPHGQGRGGAGQGASGQGRGGGMGGMGAGGARGQGGEDEEHTRASFLQEDDPEAIFGTDQVTAPPVIGE